MIDWEQLKNFGISRDYLQEKGLLEGMLKGYKTNALVPVSMNFGSAILRTDARLSFRQSVAGPVVPAMHGVRKAPEPEKPFFGHVFSEEDRKNLRESGNMGRVVEIKSRSGEYVPSFISIDKLTNEVVALKADSVFIPAEVKGVKLTENEKNDLREGKAIYPEGMLSEKGREFNAHIRINAERRGVEDPNAGKAIFVENMKRKDGEVFSSFVKLPVFIENMTNRKGEDYSAFVRLDLETGRPQYSRTPDGFSERPEWKIPAQVWGVTLSAAQRAGLQDGKAVLVEGMKGYDGREFSSYLKVNHSQGKLDYYNENPDRKKEASQRNVVAEKQTARRQDEKQEDKPEKKTKKGRSIA